jgi:recombination protein RecR
MAHHIMRAPAREAEKLSRAILEVKEKVSHCSLCYNLTEQNPCEICQDPARDQGVVCVVEEPGDIYSIEKAAGFKGLYHVLMGALSPLDGIGPEELRIEALVERIKSGNVKEVIIATNPTLSGEATAMYLLKTLKPLKVRMTRIAHGLPVGGHLEFADEITLARSFEGRREL